MGVELRKEKARRIHGIERIQHMYRTLFIVIVNVNEELWNFNRIHPSKVSPNGIFYRPAQKHIIF